MRIYPLLTAALMSAFICGAKEHGTGLAAQNGHPAKQAAKTTAMHQRIIGYSYHQLSTSVINDTVKFIYNTNARGSGTIGWGTALYPDPMQTPQLIKCDSFTYKLQGTNDRGRLWYNSSNEAIEMRYDTSGPSGYQMKDHHYYYYDASHRRIADSEYYVPYASSYKRFRTYDGSGFPIVDSSFNFTTGLPSYKYVFVNNAAGDPTLSTYYVWNSSTSAWDASQRTTTTYDGSGRRTLSVTELYTSGTWNNYYKDTLAYTGSFTDESYRAIFTWVSGAWAGSTANSYHFDAAGKWDTTWYYTWNNITSVFVITEKDFFLYNSAGNISIGQGIMYDAGTSTYAPTPYDINNFYYEDYDDAGVRDTSPLTGLKAYPNPVEGVLRIDMSDISSSNALQVRITDIQGRVMMNADVDGLAGALFDVSAYAPGTYVLTVASEGRSATQVFVKK